MSRDKTYKQDPNNARAHGEGNKALVKKSIKELGAGRSIVVDNTGTIVGGNQTYESAMELGLNIIEIESDGTDLVVVKRTDLDYNDRKRKELAIADNSTSDTSEFIETAFEGEYFKEVDFEDWGVSFEEDLPEYTKEGDNQKYTGGEGIDEQDEPYTMRVEAPIYEIKGDKPDYNELVNEDKVFELVNKIKESSIPNEDKDFLIKAAQRHLVFNYENIAEFYAHSAKATQELMEDSALVIIDFKKAIELGYVRLSEEIASRYLEDYGNEE